MPMLHHVYDAQEKHNFSRCIKSVMSTWNVGFDWRRVVTLKKRLYQGFAKGVSA